MAWTFERIGDFGDVLDGPAWDGQGLLFCKVLKSEILRYDPIAGKCETFRRFSLRNSGLAFAPNGNLYGAQSGSRRVVWYKNDGSTIYLNARLAGARHNHPHDLVVDRKGRIWFSDPYSHLRTRGPQIFPPLDHCSVLRLEYETPPREWIVRRMTQDTAEPRGLTLSPDERTLYVADSPSASDGRRQLRAYPISGDGALGVPIVLHSFGADHRGAHRGAAGMCCDGDGNILVTAGSTRSGPGPLVYVFAPSGQVLESHRVPADTPTNCAFGGPELATLFVTTEDGGLFQVKDTGRRGVARKQGRTAHA
jgi:gluconolactonase